MHAVADIGCVAVDGVGTLQKKTLICLNFFGFNFFFKYIYLKAQYVIYIYVKIIAWH